ncbi:MAG TPA: hypothetical protein VEQ61_08810, partial [Thermoleophilaceae bacterium]|nr:hypothetical protein [Thermoleophilaceae bacterium]
MDAREQATPEDLPPLELRVLRELGLTESSGPGRDPHISAASGVVRRGDFVYVIGDDELGLGVFHISSADPGELRQALSGELPTADSERAREKPDLEGLTTLPPFEGAPYGGLFGLGSGSAPYRDRGFFWPLAPDGGLEGDSWEISLHPVYELLRKDVADLNIEGASVMGERLWLLHRANAGKGPNVIAELELERVMASLRGDRSIDPEELAGLRGYELGELDGVPLCFSDASPLADQALVFTASAEDEDGKISGSVVGTISLDGKVQRLRTIDRRWKVEGVYASIDTGVMDM